MATFLSILVQILIFVCVYWIYNCECVRAGGFITTQIGPKPLWNDTHLDKLKKHLLMNYDKYARPEDHNTTTIVNIGLTVVYLETTETKSTVTIQCLLNLEWWDSKLKWNKNDFGGLSLMRIGDHEVWQPDICPYYSASGGDQIPRFANRVNVVVYESGKVVWVTPVKITVPCEYNLRYWPFDTQHCYLRMGSWVHSDNEINIQLKSNESSMEVSAIALNSAWSIATTAEKLTKKYSCCDESYSDVKFHLTLTRKSAPYVAIIMTPAVVTTFLILMQFFLPPHAGEKIILNGFTILLLNVFLLYFNHQVSSTGCSIPLIVLFYSVSLYIVGLAMVSSVVGFSLCRLRKLRPLPAIIKRLLQGRIGNWLLLDYSSKEVCTKTRSNSIEEMKDHQVSEFENGTPNLLGSENLNRLDWIIFLVAIDRTFFIIYCFVFVVMAIAFL